MYYIGIDVGSTTLGLATCNEINKIPSPWTIIRFNKNNFVQAVVLLKNKLKIYQNEAITFIIGWPINKDGSLNDATNRVEQFINQLKIQIPNCLYKLQDERYTTKFAKELLFDMNLKGSMRDKTIDKISATLILEMFLNGQ